MTLKIAIVTDIHHGKDMEAKKGGSAIPLLGEFARMVAREAPDLVLDLGDRISDEDPETDLALERDVSAAFQPIRELAPVRHILGNHDRDFQSIAQNEEIFGQSFASETIDLKGWRIALFQADTLIRRPGGFHCPDADLAWLERTVAAADRPLLIASHVPVSGHSQIGNYYFQRNQDLSTYPQGEAIREILRGSKVPTAWVAGHVHWNTLTIVDGIPHITLQSLTESYVMGSERGAGAACGAFGLLSLSMEQLDWRVMGADPFQASLPVAPMARRWYAPKEPFTGSPESEERWARIAAFQATQQQAAE